MKINKSMLIALSMGACAQAASAKAPVGAVPVGSPADWVGSQDYPRAALQFHMAGTTAFRLAVDSTGKPSRCEIRSSSGFDVVDAAPCDNVMGKARFSAARNAAGQPVESGYTGRVRWVLPAAATTAISERLWSMLLAVDQTGKVASCRFVFHFPVEGASPGQNPCEFELKSTPPAFGQELRGSFQGSLVNVEIEMADVFTPALRERALAAMPGYEQRALYIFDFTVTSDSKLGECRWEEQRGSILLAQDFCAQAGRASFDPPFSAIGKDGVASGWHIMRVMLKTTG